MAESTLSSREPAGPHVIRCAECQELVPADRVRHREERIKVAAAPAPGRWRAGGPPIFRPIAPGPRVGARPGSPPASSPPQSAHMIERVPVCVDCLRRQRIGLYSVCAIAAICFVVAAVLYSHVEPSMSGQQVAVLTPDEAAPMRGAARGPSASTPTSGDATTIASGAPSGEGETRDSPPIWQPIWDAAASLFASSSPPSTAPASPAADAAPSSTVVASAAPAAPTAPAPAAATAQPTPPANDTSARSDSAQPAATPSTDTADAAPSAPPIWETQRKSPRKVAAATSAARRAGPNVNAVALRNNGYAALQQRRYGEALTMLRQATTLGDPYAPMYLGQLFERGIGVPRDVGQASYWYGIAIDRGNGAALAAFNRMRVSPY